MPPPLVEGMKVENEKLKQAVYDIIDMAREYTVKGHDDWSFDMTTFEVMQNAMTRLQPFVK